MTEIKHRAILITESKNFNNNDITFRKDFKFNGHNNIEKDMLEALKDMDKAGIINIKKLTNLLKIEKGLNIIDVIEIATTKKDDWRIIE
jgi:hypothetical protein